MHDNYTYSSDGKKLISIPENTVHMIINENIETLWDNVTMNAQSTLKTVTFLSPSNLNALQQYTFTNCTLLEEIDFRNCSNLRTILSWTFAGCSSLKSVLFPDSLMFFDTLCFVGTKIEKFTVTPNLIRLGYRSFQNVVTLTHIDFSRGYSLTHFHGNCLEGTSIQYLDLRNCTNINHLDDQCFSNCHDLKYVYFPCLSRSTYIGHLCFFNCTSLERVVFAKCSHNIAVSASLFSLCEKLILPHALVFPQPLTCNQKKNKFINYSLVYILILLE